MAKVPGAAQIGQGPSLRDPGVNAPAAAFDMGGAALQEAGAKLGEIAERRRQTQQTVDRIEKSARARELTFQAYTDWQKSTDIRSEDSVESFVKALDERYDTILSEHKGDEQSHAQLKADLTNLRVDSLYKASTESTLARREFIVNAYNGQVNEQAGRLFQTPETLPDELAASDANLEALSEGLNTRVLQELKTRGRATLVRTALDGAIARGDFGMASEIMSDTNVYMQALPADEQRQYRARAIAAQAATDERTAFQKDVEYLQGKGIVFSPEELKKMKGLTPAERNQTLQDIEAYEGRMGRPATPEEIQGFFDVEAPDNEDAKPFGSSPRGRSMQYIIEDMDRFAQGVTTRQGDLRFLASANELLRPTVNPVSGEKVAASIPPNLPAALAARGYMINDKGTAIVPIPGQEGQVAPVAAPATDANPTGRQALSAESAFVDKVTSIMDDATPLDAAAPDADLFGNADDTVGIWPNVGRALARTPGIGGVLLDAPDMTQAGFTATLIRDRVARALSQTKEFASRELADIKDDLGNWETVRSSPEAFRNQLISLDAQLWRMEEDYKERSANEDLDPKERKRVRTLLEEIDAARDAFGVRQRRVFTRAEVEALEPGTPYITPDNVLLWR